MTEAYLDIETTGLSPESSEITVIGIHLVEDAGERFVQLVGDGITTKSLLDALDGVSLINTYNGSRFDLPFIQMRLGVDLTRDFAHCDLMYDCWKNNLYGGLKRVEQTLGISRRLQGINGLEAVRLWWRYINDYDEDALRTLCEYNREDVVNLKCLKEKLLPEQCIGRKLRLSPEQRKQKIESFGAAYARIRKVLRPMTEEALRYKPGSLAWSTHEIIIHLADAEANGYVRFRRFVAEPGSMVTGYDQDRWANRLDYCGQNMEDALILFKTLRDMTYPLLKKLPEEQWLATVEHSERGLMTLEDWLETYDNHAGEHLVQIAYNFEMWKKEISNTR
jgi:hypothetical protein